MRIIKVEKNIVTQVKFLSDGYECKENEYVSEIGELEQQRLENGTFENIEREIIEPEPTIEDQILTETKYQTVLLEMSTGF